MAVKNSDGTVTVKTTGAIFRTVSGSGTGRVVQPAYNGFNGGGSSLVFVGFPRRNWRIVSKTER